jgi:hypothetical protein
VTDERTWLALLSPDATPDELYEVCRTPQGVLGFSSVQDVLRGGAARAY